VGLVQKRRKFTLSIVAIAVIVLAYWLWPPTIAIA
jgi:hypothetical protein